MERRIYQVQANGDAADERAHEYHHVRELVELLLRPYERERQSTPGHRLEEAQVPGPADAIVQ